MSFLLKGVKLKLEQSNHKYKENADKRRRLHEFEVCDEVMAHLKEESFSFGTYSKLKMRNFGPCKILRKFDNGNAYKVELPDGMDISLYSMFLIYMSIMNQMMKLLYQMIILRNRLKKLNRY